MMFENALREMEEQVGLHSPESYKAWGKQEAAEEILAYVRTRVQRLSEVALLSTIPAQQRQAEHAMGELNILENKIKEAFNV